MSSSILLLLQNHCCYYGEIISAQFARKDAIHKMEFQALSEKDEESTCSIQPKSVTCFIVRLSYLNTAHSNFLVLVDDDNDSTKLRI